MPSEALKRAQAKYEKAKIKRVIVKLHKNYDASIINYLDSKENVTAYIKQLIRADMEMGGE